MTQTHILGKLFILLLQGLPVLHIYTTDIFH